MIKHKRKLSFPAFILLFICVAAFTIVALLVFISTKNTRKLSASVELLTKPSTSINFLYRINEELLLAENKYRAYLSGNMPAAKKEYDQHIHNFSRAIDSLDFYVDPRVLDAVEVQLDKKIKLSQAVGYLKQLSDSLLRLSDIDFIHVAQFENVPLPGFSIKRISSFASELTDTIRTETIKKIKKTGGLFNTGLFGKTVDSTSVATTYKKGNSRIKYGDRSDTLHANKEGVVKKFANEIQYHYQSSLSSYLGVRRQQEQKELALSQINLHIINDLENLFHAILKEEQISREAEMGRAFLQTGLAQKASNKVIITGAVLLLILILILGYYTSVVNKYENDIIQKREIAENLAEVKTRFLNNMSHEIRTPLTAIIGFAEQMQKQRGYKAEHINAVKTSADQLLATVNDVLDFSKLEAAKFVFNNKPFLLKQAIDDVVLSMAVNADKKGLQLVNNNLIAADVVEDGDAFRLKQMLYNLIGNAIKFTEQGTVTITNKIENGTRTTIVEDTGIGIPKHKLLTIFDEYEQVGDSQNFIKGTGLGLAIVKMLSGIRGGEISVISTLGKGSAFTVTDPFKASQTKAADLMAKERGWKIEKGTGSSKNDAQKILIVEDNEMNVMLISYLFDLNNLAYDVAQDANTALVLFDKNIYSLVVTDINLPGMSGLELTKAIRTRSSADKKDIPVIALTANAVSEKKIEYYELGISDVIHKPFTEDDLLNKLQHYINIPPQPK